MRRIAFLALALALGACRGQPSQKEPIHLFGDMDWQPKYQAEEASPLWQDGRAQRPLVEGVVGRRSIHDEYIDDEAYMTGMVGDKYVAKAPITVDEQVLKRGEDRFNIYCRPCHDRTGSSRGLAVQRGYPPAAVLTGDRVVGMPDGQIFWTISHGVRNMPTYRKQVPVADRWAIVTWVRVLGRAANAKLADVPSDVQNQILPEEAP